MANFSPSLFKRNFCPDSEVTVKWEKGNTVFFQGARTQ